MKKSVKALLVFLVIAVICVPSLMLFAGCYDTHEIDGIQYRIFSNYAEVVSFNFNSDYPQYAQVCVVPAQVEYNDKIYPVTAIGDGHHGRNQLVSDGGYASELVIPHTVQEIRFEDYESNSFSYLTKYTVHQLNEVYASIDGVLFDKSYNTLLRYPRFNSVESFTIPLQTKLIKEESGMWDNELVREINVEAGNQTYASSDGVLFSANLTTLLLYPQGRQVDTFTLPKQTTTIDRQSRFWNNVNLKYIEVEEGNVYYKVEDNVLYSTDGSELVYRPRSEQKHFAIPSTVSVVGYNALPGVANLFVPKSVTLFMDAFMYGDFSVFNIANIYFESSVLPNYLTVKKLSNTNVYTNVTLDEFNALFEI